MVTACLRFVRVDEGRYQINSFKTFFAWITAALLINRLFAAAFPVGGRFLAKDVIKKDPSPYTVLYGTCNFGEGEKNWFLKKVFGKVEKNSQPDYCSNGHIFTTVKPVKILTRAVKIVRSRKQTHILVVANQKQ